MNYFQIVLGEVVSRPAVLNPIVVDELVAIGNEMEFDTVAGKTVCTNDFYEGENQTNKFMHTFEE